MRDKSEVLRELYYANSKLDTLMEMKAELEEKINHLFSQCQDLEAELDTYPLTEEEREAQRDADERAWERNTRRAESGYCD